MGVTVKYTWAGRGGCTYLWEILFRVCADDPTVWVGDVGGDPPHGANLGGGFHHCVERRLTGNLPLLCTDRVWYNLPLEYDPMEDGLEDMTVYIARRHNRVA